MEASFSAQLAYDAMAPVYDDFTARYDYEGWLADLLKLLERRGLKVGRLLDVACGTGKSFLPMVPRGWRITGCDVSPAMVALAEKKVAGSVELLVADMRQLPKLGAFDLVWALDDAINYLLDGEELRAALLGMRENLTKAGLLLFDVNELIVYRSFYAETTVLEQDGFRFTWQGLGSTEVLPGEVSESRLEVEPSDRGGSLEANGNVSLHRQRHFPEAEVLTALKDAGLQCLDVYGHGLDGVPCKPLDVELHTKAIYIASISR